MAVLELPAATREFLYARKIKAFDAASPDSAVDPRTLPVQFAVIVPGIDPVELDWVDAEWFDQTTARILTGAGGDISRPVGRYTIWLRVTGAVERPERRVGTLVVT